MTLAAALLLGTAAFAQQTNNPTARASASRSSARAKLIPTR
jgi:hypothetical protein